MSSHEETEEKMNQNEEKSNSASNNSLINKKISKLSLSSISSKNNEDEFIKSSSSSKNSLLDNKIQEKSEILLGNDKVNNEKSPSNTSLKNNNESNPPMSMLINEKINKITDDNSKKSNSSSSSSFEKKNEEQQSNSNDGNELNNQSNSSLKNQDNNSDADDEQSKSSLLEDDWVKDNESSNNLNSSSKKENNENSSKASSKKENSSNSSCTSQNNPEMQYNSSDSSSNKDNERKNDEEQNNSNSSSINKDKNSDKVNKNEETRNFLFEPIDFNSDDFNKPVPTINQVESTMIPFDFESFEDEEIADPSIVTVSREYSKSNKENNDSPFLNKKSEKNNDEDPKGKKGNLGPSIYHPITPDNELEDSSENTDNHSNNLDNNGILNKQINEKEDSLLARDGDTNSFQNEKQEKSNFENSHGGGTTTQEFLFQNSNALMNYQKETNNNKHRVRFSASLNEPPTKTSTYPNDKDRIFALKTSNVFDPFELKKDISNSDESDKAKELSEDNNSKKSDKIINSSSHKMESSKSNSDNDFDKHKDQSNSLEYNEKDNTSDDNGKSVFSHTAPQKTRLYVIDPMKSELYMTPLELQKMINEEEPSRDGDDLNKSIKKFKQTGRLSDNSDTPKMIQQLQRDRVNAIINGDYDKAKEIDSTTSKITMAYSQQVQREKNDKKIRQLEERLENERNRYEEFKKSCQEKLKKEEENLQGRCANLQKLHDQEISDFESKWNSEDYLRRYSKPSPKFLQLKAVERSMVITRMFDQAKQMRTSSRTLEKRETCDAQDRARKIMITEKTRIKSRQDKEFEDFQEKCDKIIETLKNSMKKDEIPYKNRIASLERMIENLKVSSSKTVPMVLPLPKNSSDGTSTELLTSRTAFKYSAYKAQTYNYKLNIQPFRNCSKGIRKSRVIRIKK